MRIVAIVNRKGGSGKTTVAMNLAAVLTEKSRTVTLRDMDPQRSAAMWSEQRQERDEKLPFKVQSLDAEKHAAEIRAELRGQGDIVLLDTPPELARSAMLALMLADLALLPVGASPLDLWAAKAAVQMAREARSQRRGGVPLVSLVPSRVIVGTNLARDLPDALKALGEPVAPAVSQRVATAESAISGRTVSEYAPGSPAHLEFQQLGKHVLNRLRSEQWQKTA